MVGNKIDSEVFRAAEEEFELKVRDRLIAFIRTEICYRCPKVNTCESPCPLVKLFAGRHKYGVASTLSKRN